jgi:RNA polymerase primary sigma factor
MTSEIKVAPRSEDMQEKEDPEGPPLDLFDAAVTLLHSATKRGYVTNAEIKALFSSEEDKSEQIEDILARFNEMDIRVVETDPELEVEEVATHVRPDEEAEGELVEVQQRPISVKSEAKDPAERTDDPVRMYLRDMGSVAFRR